MIIKLENQFFTTEISTKGAELHSLVRKSDGKDIIWRGDKNVWGESCADFVSICGEVLGGLFCN